MIRHITIQMDQQSITSLGVHDISRRRAVVRNFVPFAFGNASPSISLSEWPQSSIPRTSGRCEIIIDENDPDKLYQLLLSMVKCSPNDVEIYADSEAFQTVLKDRHVALLKDVEYIAVPKSCGITDSCLPALRRCNAICLAACENMTLDTIAHLALQSELFCQVKLWGWGSRTRSCIPISPKFFEAIESKLIKQ